MSPRYEGKPTALLEMRLGHSRVVQESRLLDDPTGFLAVADGVLASVKSGDARPPGVN